MDSWLVRFISVRPLRKYPSLKLAFFWIAGLFVGLGLFGLSGISPESLLRESMMGPVSAEALLVRVMVPFLICVAGILLDQHWLIYVCAFCKAVLLAFASMCTMIAFGSGGWLIRFLFLFTDTLMCVVWYGFWMDSLSRTSFSTVKAMFLCAVGFFIAGVDLRVISPLLMRIINC